VGNPTALRIGAHALMRRGPGCSDRKYATLHSLSGTDRRRTSRGMPEKRTPTSGSRTTGSPVEPVAQTTTFSSSATCHCSWASRREHGLSTSLPIQSWSDLKEVFVGNFQGIYQRPSNPWTTGAASKSKGSLSVIISGASASSATPCPTSPTPTSSGHSSGPPTSP